MGINPYQLESYVIEPVLHELGLYSMGAVELLLGTAAVESHMGHFIRQIQGPALGIYQIEPATHDDIWTNYIAYRGDLLDSISKVVNPDRLSDNMLVYNLQYATVMCRIHYLRVPEKLPEVGDIFGQASFWKKHYNTKAGKGSVKGYIEAYGRYLK